MPDTTNDIEFYREAVREVAGKDEVVDLYCCYPSAGNAGDCGITTIKAMRIDTAAQQGYIIIEPEKEIPEEGRTLHCVGFTYIPDYTFDEKKGGGPGEYEFLGGLFFARSRREAIFCIKNLYMDKINKCRSMERYYISKMYELG